MSSPALESSLDELTVGHRTTPDLEVSVLDLGFGYRRVIHLVDGS